LLSSISDLSGAKDVMLVLGFLVIRGILFPCPLLTEFPIWFSYLLYRGFGHLAYRLRMDVNSALPSRCLHKTPLLASAVVVSHLHMAPFPFLGGGGSRIFRRAFRISTVYSSASGCIAISQCLSNDNIISVHWVLHTVGPTIITKSN
jgi:hypothetical protein